MKKYSKYDVDKSRLDAYAESSFIPSLSNWLCSSMLILSSSFSEELTVLTRAVNFSSRPGRLPTKLVNCETINHVNRPKIRNEPKSTMMMEKIRPVFFSIRFATGKSTTENKAANESGTAMSLVKINAVMTIARMTNALSVRSSLLCEECSITRKIKNFRL